MKPVDVKSNKYIDSSKEINNKNPKFQIGENVGYQNIRMFLQKVTVQSGLKKFKILWVNTVPWTYVIYDLNGEEIVGTFYVNELQKATNQKSLQQKK